MDEQTFRYGASVVRTPSADPMRGLPPMLPPAKAALLVVAAYHGNPMTRAAAFEELGAHSVMELHAGMVQAYRVTLDGVPILVGPGTNDGLKEWLFTNLRLDPTQGRNGRFHTGAYAYASQIADWLEELGGPKPHLVVGHSLSAMWARVLTVELGWPSLTFAAPRVELSGEEIAHQDAPTVAIQRADDWITQLPPRFLGYRHVGRVIRLNPLTRHTGEDHRLPRYQEVLKEQTDPWWPYPELGLEPPAESSAKVAALVQENAALRATLQLHSSSVRPDPTGGR